MIIWLKYSEPSPPLRSLETSFFFSFFSLPAPSALETYFPLFSSISFVSLPTTPNPPSSVPCEARLCCSLFVNQPPFHASERERREGKGRERVSFPCLHISNLSSRSSLATEQDEMARFSKPHKERTLIWPVTESDALLSLHRGTFSLLKSLFLCLRLRVGCKSRNFGPWLDTIPCSD